MASATHHRQVIVFFLCMSCGPALVFCTRAAVCCPDTVMTGATVLTAAAHIHVSLPHLFKDLVLTDSYHLLAVGKLQCRDGNGRVTEICNRSRQLCVFKHMHMNDRVSLSPDTLSLLQEAYELWKHMHRGSLQAAAQQLCRRTNSRGQRERIPPALATGCPPLLQNKCDQAVDISLPANYLATCDLCVSHHYSQWVRYNDPGDSMSQQGWGKYHCEIWARVWHFCSDCFEVRNLWWDFSWGSELPVCKCDMLCSQLEKASYNSAVTSLILW